MSEFNLWYLYHTIIKRSAHLFYAFSEKGGGVMNLVYGSSSSSYMDCLVFFSDEWLLFRWSGVRMPPCSSISASVVELLIFGSTAGGVTFCCSHTFGMSTRRLPVIFFVSLIEYPFISCCLLLGVSVVAGGGSYFVCVISHVSHLRLIHSLLPIILLLPPPCALRNLYCSRFHPLTVIVLTLDIFIQWQLVALQACVYLPPLRWLPVRLG